jgi:hypothetical protein
MADDIPRPADALTTRLRALMAKATPGKMPGKEAEANHALTVLLRANLPTILAALTSPSAQAGWREIGSAPRDRLIDIWIGKDDGTGARWCDCYYDTICDQWRTSRPSGHLLTISARFVTHWREPPAPPAKESPAAVTLTEAQVREIGRTTKLLANTPLRDPLWMQKWGEHINALMAAGLLEKPDG